MSDPQDIAAKIGALSPAKRALLERHLGVTAAGGDAVPVRAGSGPEVLSFNQRRQWFLERLTPDSAAYNTAVASRLIGPLDVAALRKALQVVVDRHEVLRTRFIEKDGEPLQEVEPERELGLESVDLSDVHDAEWEARVRALASDEATSPLDVTRVPLFRFTLYRRSPSEHVLLRVVHHMITDGWSEFVFRRELGEAYSALVDGREPDLEPLALQYIDFAAWQREHLSGDVIESQRGYWRDQLAGAPPSIELLTDRPRSARPSERGARIQHDIPRDVVRRFTALANSGGATPFMALIAVYARLLRLYSGQTDVVIGIPIAGRNAPGLDGLIGFFANSLALRIDLAGDPSFADLLARVRDVSLSAFANQDLPFDLLVEELHPQRDLSRTPIFQTMLAFQNVPGSPPRFEGLRYERFDLEHGAVAFDLTLTVKPQGEVWQCVVDYRADLFATPVMERFAGGFVNLIRHVLREPEVPLSSISVTNEGDMALAAGVWNDTRTDYPRASLVNELFEEQVRATPDAPALTLGEETVSYAVLNARANRLGRRLRARGVDRESVVGVLATRSIDTVVCLLAVLKAGGAYLPLDPEEPSSRSGYMLANSGAKILLVPGGCPGDFAFDGVDSVALEAEWGVARSEPDHDLGIAGASESLAYIIYTSGSTGVPRGVEVEHRGVVRLVRGCDYANFAPDRIFLQLARVSFDASTFEIWGPLLNGGRCVIYPERVPTAGGLRDIIRRHRVTTAFITTGLFNAIVDESPESLSGLEELFTGGEAMSVPHARAALESLKQTKVFNCYGPTEGTTFTTTLELTTETLVAHRSVPIGRPIANTTAFVLDDGMNVCPVGMPGELYIGGSGVARGYVADEALTAERFVPDPFSAETGARLYRTGDVCRYLDGGLIEFVGRTDNQVKLRGFRIEPDEIVAVLNGHPGVRSSAVIVREIRQTGQSLVAYVVAESDPVPAIEDLRQHLAGRLPGFMVPASFVMLEALPLNRNGKVDVGSLPDPPEVARDDSVATQPRSATEVQLVSIWARVLGVRDIGIDDDFFELGGNSLLALRLFSDMEETLEESLPLATLFQAPTIRQLVDLWGDRGPGDGWQCVVPIQTRGDRPPFFCVHGQLGNVIAQRSLAQRMGPEQPYYAIQARGLDGRTPPLGSVGAMAEHYISEIRKVRPHGPYLIGGYCFGAMVAFEMALKLVEQGEIVPLLVMIDSPVPLESEERRALRPPFNLRKVVGGVLRRLRLIPSPHWWVTIVHRRAHHTWVARPYPGRVLHFSLTEFDPGQVSAEVRKKRWDPLIPGEHDYRVIEGHHSLVLREPSVSFIAATLNERIDELLESGAF